MKRLAIIAMITIGFISLMIVGTISYFNDREENFSRIKTGVIDLEVNGQNPLNEAVIGINNAECCHIYYEDILLHLTSDSNPAKVKMRFFNLSYGSTAAGVVHECGEEEKSGEIDIARSDGTNVTYKYEAKSNCVKFEDAEFQLGEDNTTGLTDTFIITFYNGTLPVSGKIKTGAGDQYFTINSIGDEVEIYYYDTLTYKVRLVSVAGFTFTFEVESIAKHEGTALSHVTFCFTCSQCDDCKCKDIEIDVSIINASTGERFVVIDLNEHKTLPELNDKWINLTTSDGIPEFMPCNNYILNISIHYNACHSATFDIEFYAEQINGKGLYDSEISKNNFITGDGNG